jgi:GxxExxY protein
MDKEYPLKDETERIISAAIEVHSTLGPGLLESVYEQALAEELRLRKIPFQRQHPINLKYKGVEIGDHRVDFLVNGKVVVELKAGTEMNNIFYAQLMTYLKALNLKVGLLMNFNVLKLRDGIKRIVV